jgi:hypothetical protein
MKNKTITEEDKINIRHLYESGMTQNKIKDATGFGEGRISKVLHELGVEIRSPDEYLTSKQLAKGRKYYLNEDYFESIDTDTKAYWLGFLFADGCVREELRKNGRRKGIHIEITLKYEDGYHLVNFAKCLDSSYPVKEKIVKLNNKEISCWKLSIGSVKMGEDLISWGCVPRKSLILEYPKKLKDEYFGAFFRGYMDGDGCVFGYTKDKKTSHINISVLGTKNFLLTTKEKLSLLGVETLDIKATKSKVFVMLFRNGTISNLYDLMYSNAEYFLGRKIDKFRDLLVYSGRECSMSEFSKLSYLLK